MARAKEPAGRRRLGRGLESLLGGPVKIDAAEEAPADGVTDAPTARNPPARPVSTPAPADSPFRRLSLDVVQPNPAQPRRSFDPDRLAELARSIRANGIMQPILVRPTTDGAFEIVAGERRWRAAKEAGLAEVPAIVQELDDRAAAQLALVENVQREDLNAIERAEALDRLSKDHKMTHADLAEQIGLERSTVTNLLRLNELDPTTKELVRSGSLSMGHGRALLALTNITQRSRLAADASRKGWSVREIERRTKQLGETVDGSRADEEKNEPSVRDVYMADLERQLGDHLGTQVKIKQGRKRNTGTMTISFFSLDEFEGIVGRLGFTPQS